jgi:1-aminocyclopropane-1-carboxylate deaminase/D-cysteine desulfhydrase-like pyridoxal-dependent ACC family enzyme
LGIDLWIKRDDLTGFALGGNKGRKLEYLVADALSQGADTLVSCGSLQSNFVRQLGAACSIYGLQCTAAVMGLPYLSEDERPVELGIGDSNGNVLLDEMLGVDLRTFPDGTWDDLYEHAHRIAEELRREGKMVYEVPVGGSSALGAYAFTQAALELTGAAFDWIVFASSSGSTHTGLAYAFQGTDTKVQGIACDPEPALVEDFMEIYAGLERLTGEPRPLPHSDWRLSLDFVGPGYGVPSEGGNEAIRLMARREGIFLDPIYTGKAFAGLSVLANRREIQGRVLFWHTGGVPALFAD